MYILIIVPLKERKRKTISTVDTLHISDLFHFFHFTEFFEHLHLISIDIHSLLITVFLTCIARQSQRYQFSVENRITRSLQYSNFTPNKWPNRPTETNVELEFEITLKISRVNLHPVQLPLRSKTEISQIQLLSQVCYSVFLKNIHSVINGDKQLFTITSRT